MTYDDLRRHSIRKTVFECLEPKPRDYQHLEERVLLRVPGPVHCMNHKDVRKIIRDVVSRNNIKV